jgi:hypothetical protein
MVTCTRIIEADIPGVGLREIGRIYEVEGRGTFFAATKHIALPAGRRQAYGINYLYLLEVQ